MQENGLSTFSEIPWLSLFSSMNLIALQRLELCSLILLCYTHITRIRESD